MSEEASNPFDRLRTRGLLVQLLLAVTVTVFVTSSFVPAYRTKDYISIGMLLIYAVALLVTLVRGWHADVDFGKLMGRAPVAHDLPLLAVIIPLALITAGSLTMVYVPLSYVVPELVEQTVLSDSPLFQVDTPRQLALLALMAVVAAPVVEELIFRGFIMHRLARRWGTSSGILVSSALFAVPHVEWVGHFVIGVAFALLYQRTRSLWLAMLAHASYNALFILPYVWSVLHHEKPEAASSLAEFRDGLGVGVLTFISGAALMMMYLDLYWKEVPVARVVSSPVPYDAEAEPDSTSVS